MKPFTALAAVIFALVALAQGYRLATHFVVIIGSHSLPMWLSVVGLVVAGGLAVMLWRESRGAPASFRNWSR